ncbi:hypothetical protein [Duffyella gerundensis]|jgi:hypothetical protein|uniref:hypothetical protein n=1 Tax=Duffyella TaxID=3026546 RepID=UPI003F6DDBA8
MVKLYVVDRYNRYRENHIVSLKTSKDITPIELSHLAMALFPDSVSDQGNYYFLSNSPYVNPTINIDWSFEFYRRARHPDKPSSWQCLYAWQHLDEALSFRSSNGSPGDPIYEIDTDQRNCHIADMILLDNPDLALIHTYRAELYWQGKTMPNHLLKGWRTQWEVLVPLPLTVGRQI